MGVPLPAERGEGSIPGYHCWAEFYLEGKGWVPIDASEASKNPARMEELFGGTDANRIHFTTGRDIQIPTAGADRVNFSIYPHVEVDGVVHAGVRTGFSYRDIH
jgi:transglutaminase-like putative cysteine protease